MPKWVRVKDSKTGHEYDIRADARRPDGVTLVERVPDLEGRTARPRRAKHHVTKAGKPSTTTTAAPKSDGPKEKESDNG